MKLLSRIDSASPNAPVVVLFGGNPLRRHEVLSLLQGLGEVSAIGALSEAEGMSLLRSLPRVDVVLIGGRYSEVERERIRALVGERWPQARLSEPGWTYHYENEAILADVRRQIAAATAMGAGA